MAEVSEATNLLLKNEGLGAGKKGLSAGFVGFEDSKFAMKASIGCIILYLVFSVIFFSFIFETQWTIIDALYFAVVTFTTIGYGDLSPETYPGKIFAMFFILFGIGIVAVALGIAGEKLIEIQEEKLKKVEQKAQKRVIGMVNKNDDDEDEGETKGYCCKLTNILIADSPFIAVLLIFAFVIGYLEGWEWIDCLYYGVVTFTTVGYGDISPVTQASRLLSVIFLPIFVTILAKFLSSIANIYLEVQQENSEQEFLDRELTLGDLNAMDENNDNEVSLSEFLSFMLVAMQKVDKELIDELTELFHSLDETKDGLLNKEDLMARSIKKKAVMKMKSKTKAKASTSETGAIV